MESELDIILNSTPEKENIKNGEETSLPTPPSIPHLNGWSELVNPLNEDEPKYAQVVRSQAKKNAFEVNLTKCDGEDDDDNDVSEMPNANQPFLPKATTNGSSVVMTSANGDADTLQVISHAASVMSESHPMSVGSGRRKVRIPDDDFNNTMAHRQRIDSIQGICSALYCKILIILGLAFPMAEVISDYVPRGYYQLFYVYLFLGSLFFLLAIYVDLWKTQAKWSIAKKKRAQNNDGNGSGSESDYFDGNTKLPRPRVHYGSFYLRLGAVLFGIGSMIYSGIEIGMFFELNMDKTANCHNLFSVIRPSLQMIFVFVQMYFIFLNQKMNIYKNKLMSRFGLMHMIATNLCTWLNVLILETSHSIMHALREHDDAHAAAFNGTDHSEFHDSLHELEIHNGEIHDDSHDADNSSDFSFDPHMFDISHMVSICQRNDNIMSKLLTNSAPFLFPCTIEYSLICAAVLFVMWKNIRDEHEHYKHQKRRQKITRSLHVTLNATSNRSSDPDSMDDDSRSAHHYSVDCTHANSGLFTGIFVMVIVIISLIVFFVLITSNDDGLFNVGIMVASLTELSLYVITTVAVLIGMCQVNQLWYDNSSKLELDNLLLVVAQTGVYIYSAFCIIGSFFNLEEHPLNFFASLATLVQTTLQTVFILDASSRYARNKEQVKDKPGREIVTFLLVCNLAMWTILSLETNRADVHPIQIDFYGGTWAWPIITHVSMPLAIFYRFHSTVCLCEIWKKTFKFKSQCRTFA